MICARTARRENLCNDTRAKRDDTPNITPARPYRYTIPNNLQTLGRIYEPMHPYPTYRILQLIFYTWYEYIPPDHTPHGFRATLGISTACGQVATWHQVYRYATSSVPRIK